MFETEMIILAMNVSHKQSKPLFIISNSLFFILSQSKRCLLHVISGGVWIKTVQESTKNAS